MEDVLREKAQGEPEGALGELVYGIDRKIIDKLIDMNEMTRGNKFLSAVLKTATGTVPGIGDMDITTGEGLCQAVLAVSISSGCVVGGAETAAGLVRIIPLMYKAVRGLLTRDDRRFLEKAWGLTRPVIDAFTGYINDIVERVKNAGYTRNKINILRQVGHIIGEFIGGAYVGGKALEGAKFSFRKMIGGRINGVSGKTVEEVGKAKITARGKPGKAHSAGHGKPVSRGLGGDLKAFEGRIGQFDESMRLFSGDGMGKSYGMGSQTKVPGVRGGSGGFGKTVLREIVRTGAERIAAVAERIATGAERITAISVRTGLSFLAKAFRVIAGEVIGAYIGKQGTKAIDEIATGKGPLAQAARGIYQACKKTGFGGSHSFRPGWLAYGIGSGILRALNYDVGGGIIPPRDLMGEGAISGFVGRIADLALGVYDESCGEDLFMETAQTAKDIVYPDFNDPTDIGANFWGGVYEDIHTGYNAIIGSGKTIFDVSRDIKEITYQGHSGTVGDINRFSVAKHGGDFYTDFNFKGEGYVSAVEFTTISPYSKGSISIDKLAIIGKAGLTGFDAELSAAVIGSVANTSYSQSKI
ncbi:MAG: hypothetical protein GF350_05015 [Chitinivibrionales bacterium]|nr:hypothetical protein [Chitinivibrionales bacterium]